MTYNRKYNLQVNANPTVPGIETRVQQTFDGKHLTDRYLKRLTKVLRTGVFGPYGGMYQLATLAAKHIGVQPPVAARISTWGDVRVMQGGFAPPNIKLKPWKDLIKLSDVRAAMQFANLPVNKWQPEPQKAEVSDWGLGLPGWARAERVAFIAAVKEAAFAQKNYASDMEKLAAFLESRPKFEVTDAVLGVINVKHRVTIMAPGKD